METKILNLEKGRDLYAKNEYDEAEKYLLEAAEYFTDYADIWNMLGVISNTKNDIESAQKYFEKALDLNPGYTDAALNLAVTYNEQGKYKRARQIHKQAVKTTVNSKGIELFAIGKITNMHAELAAAYSELKMNDKAVEQYRAALGLSPDFVDIRTKFAQLLREIGRLKEAAVQLKMVLEHKADYMPALISLGMTYYALGDKDSAEIYWERALGIQPDNKSAGMYLRMVRQMKAMEDAEVEGVHMEVEIDNHPLITEQDSADSDTDEIQFTLDDKSS